MNIRATLFGLLVVLVCGCGGSQNKVMADTPVLPYQAPDISEITGIEEPDESEPEAPPPAKMTAPAPAHAPAPAKAPEAAAPPAKTPAAKAKTPAAPAKAAGSAAPPK